MKSFLLILIAWLFATSSGWASSDLDELLNSQRKGDPGAFISSGFYDWRSVSKYRRHPGLHYGYDIAMLSGTPVRATWPGVVVAVTPWFGDEFGITVRGSEGLEVTYGHVLPLVTPGERVEAGRILGRVAVDHVDVKVRDTEGRFLDIARGDRLIVQTASAPAILPVDKSSINDLLVQLHQERQRYQVGLASRNSVLKLEQKLATLGEPLPAQLAPAVQSSGGRRVTDQLVLNSSFTIGSQQPHTNHLGSGSASPVSTYHDR